MSFLVLVILVLATYRLARVVAQDDITEGFRQRVFGRGGGSALWTWFYRLIMCPQCCGVWLAFATTGIWFWAQSWPGTPEYLIWAVAVAGGQSAMATLSHRLDTLG